MTIKTTSQALVPEAFPLLQRLGLRDEELHALAGQGFLGSENRGGKTVFRLRYRLRGRQHVRYVSPRDATGVEAELASLQRRVRARRHLMDLADLARQALRQRRLALAALLEARGYHFHGQQLRRWRNAK